MKKDEIIEYLEEKLERLKRDEPYAVNPINALEKVIVFLGNEE